MNVTEITVVDGEEPEGDFRILVDNERSFSSPKIVESQIVGNAMIAHVKAKPN